MYQPMQSILPLGSNAILLDKDVCPIVKDYKKIKKYCHDICKQEIDTICNPRSYLINLQTIAVQ